MQFIYISPEKYYSEVLIVNFCIIRVIGDNILLYAFLCFLTFSSKKLQIYNMLIKIHLSTK